ncbi:hypothetical protein D9M68_557290 [compost metagenome]
MQARFAHDLAARIQQRLDYVSMVLSVRHFLQRAARGASWMARYVNGVFDNNLEPARSQREFFNNDGHSDYLNVEKK